MNSPGHRRNILSPKYAHMGAGRTGTHWTQTFGSSQAEGCDGGSQRSQPSERPADTPNQRPADPSQRPADTPSQRPTQSPGSSYVCLPGGDLMGDEIDIIQVPSQAACEAACDSANGAAALGRAA